MSYNRIRTKDTQRNETKMVPVFRRKFSSVPIPPNDSYSTVPVLPDTPTTTLDSVPADMRYDRDRIVDEASADRRLKDCDHMKIRVQPVEPVEHADNGYGSYARQTYPPKRNVAYMWRGVLNSRIPMFAAWKAAGPGSLLSLSALSNVNENALLSALGGSAPPDRLGELPAQIVAAIEEWHLMTTVAESQDYGRLLDLARKRGPLRSTGAAVQNWLRSRNDFSRRYRGKTTRQTLWNLGSAFRNGTLGYNFGIMPTVGEVRTISEMLSDGLKPAQTRITRTIRGHGQANKTFASSGTSPNAYYGKFRRREDIVMERVDGMVAELKRPIVRNTSMRNMLNRLVGVSGARIIWDFVPWSFVVDWFLSVDDALDTLYLGAQTEYDIGSWSSTKLTYTREVTCGQLSIEEFFPANQMIFIEAPPLRAAYTHYNRTRRPIPTVLDSLRFRMGPKQGFLTVLLGLGLVPRSLARKVMRKLV